MSREMLAFARGERVLLERRVLVGEFAREVAELITPELDERGIHLQMDVRYRGHWSMDPVKITRAIVNLARNAAEAMAPGGLFELSIACEGDPAQPEALVLGFSDSGHGVPESVRDTLFESFVTAGKSGGTGLGLAVVQKLMHIMGGLVGVESTPGVGSHFWIELERCYSQINELKSSDLIEFDSGTGTKMSGTVLYIEDNVSNIELIDQVLSGSRPGINLITNMYGGQALSLAKQLKPQLILLDLNLPDIHGSEVLEQLLADDETKDIPVVVISADAMQRQLNHLMEAGAREYLTKPIDIKNFLKVIDTFLPPS
jgi:CheY-like chemotaxis protein